MCIHMTKFNILLMDGLEVTINSLSTCKNMQKSDSYDYKNRVLNLT